MEVVVSNPGPPQQLQTSPQALMVVEPALDEQELKTPKKRAETWVQDEIKALIALRKEMDTLFNTSKSNKHLWEQISLKMKERGYERSATMCTDKWRNLLKEFKKAKHLDRGGSAKVACYKDLEELLGDRVKTQTPSKATTPAAASKIETPSSLLTPASKAMGEEEAMGEGGEAMGRGESFLQMLVGGDGSGGFDGFNKLNVTTRSALNLERRLDHDGHPSAIPSTDAMGQSVLMPANGITPPQAQWNWRDSNSNGLHRSATNVGPEVVLGLPHQGPAGGRHVETPSNWVNQSNATAPLNGGERRSAGAPMGKIIVVKCGDIARRIRIDGPFESIKESIKTAFGLRSKRGFWLEDEEGVVQTISRDMPSGEFTLNLDPGITVKICSYEGERLTGNTESKTLYSEEDFREFLTRRGWAGLREVGGFKDIDSVEELRPGAVYQRAWIVVA
ncbi:unnamed protein product [Calypogeia fissa]